MFSLKCILNHYWNNYFNSGRYFNSGCDVKLCLKFILNLYWNNYFNSGRYFNSGCNNAHVYVCSNGHLTESGFLDGCETETVTFWVREYRIVILEIVIFFLASIFVPYLYITNKHIFGNYGWFYWLILLESNFLHIDNIYMLYFWKNEHPSNLPTIWLILVIYW